MALNFLKSIRTKTKAEALAPTADKNALYFPTDASTVIMGGKEYGFDVTSLQRNTILAMTAGLDLELSRDSSALVPIRTLGQDVLLVKGVRGDKMEVSITSNGFRMDFEDGESYELPGDADILSVKLTSLGDGFDTGKIRLFLKRQIV